MGKPILHLEGDDAILAAHIIVHVAPQKDPYWDCATWCPFGEACYPAPQDGCVPLMDKIEPMLKQWLKDRKDAR